MAVALQLYYITKYQDTRYSQNLTEITSNQCQCISSQLIAAGKEK